MYIFKFVFIQYSDTGHTNDIIDDLSGHKMK